ncbi:uncharacterized protein LOC110706736 [Chenopodium quinoa]|uniref:uncharacterized protein LOC110706736 n=1 Tax=Chenopodium quinoa TaxID=63459 RepID=UPI000B771F86|nr:uncharacterized protein LOC110706736 [Chenopodium quinoa]
MSNIKDCIPLILDRQTVQYSNWEELFEVHAHTYNVLDYIDSKMPRPTRISNSLWQRLDSVVKQWIYGTISTDLLQTVLSKGDMAQQVWHKIKAIFQDNKMTRVLYLEKQFTDLHLSAFSDVSSYCKQLKCLKDQLASVDQPVLELMLVMRLIAGFCNTDFDVVAAIFAQTEPLPSFETTRSLLLLEETTCTNEQSAPAQSFITQQTDSRSQQQPQGRNSCSGTGGNSNGGRGSDKGGEGCRGKGRGMGKPSPKSNQPAQSSQQSPPNNSGSS